MQGTVEFSGRRALIRDLQAGIAGGRARATVEVTWPGEEWAEGQLGSQTLTVRVLSLISLGGLFDAQDAWGVLGVFRRLLQLPAEVAGP